MKKILAILPLLALSLSRGYGQGARKLPAFDVASITPCKPGTPESPLEHMGMVQFIYPGGMFRANATTLKYLLEWAYGIQPSQHTAGPSWIGTDRYDIVAKAEGNPSDDQMKLMVQALLADRFKLQLHHENRELRAIVISVGKTAPKLFPPKDGETHGLRFAPQTGPDGKTVSNRVMATRYTLAQLVDVFARNVDSVVVDQTGLNGEFDFTIELTPDEHQPNPIDPGILLTALHEQLGLTVKSEKVSVDVFVIDGAEKVAAGN